MNHNLNVVFDYNNPVISWLPYKDSISYNVYRGLTKDNLDKIANTRLLQYKDNEIDIRQKFDRVNYLYKVSSVDNDNKETFFTEPVYFETQINYPYRGVVNEIIRRNDLMINRISGEPVELYLKKGAGERCSKYNQVTKNHEGLTELCEECYNTTFKGGFELIETKIRIKNANDSITETPYGIKIDAGVKQGFLSVYPIVNTGDWLRTKYGQIYLFDEVKHKRFQGILTVQIVTLKLLDTGHSYYKIKLN